VNAAEPPQTELLPIKIHFVTEMSLPGSNV
jgi:hypothetical protein